MPDGVSIRLMKPGEEGEVCALVARVFDKFVAPDFPPEGIDEFYRCAGADAMVKRTNVDCQVLVAEEENRIVGMLELKGFDHIAMLFSEIQGRGIGTKLVKHALRLCQQNAAGAKRVTVHASRYATPIYRKLGFKAEGSECTENGITYLPMVFQLKAGS